MFIFSTKIISFKVEEQLPVDDFSEFNKKMELPLKDNVVSFYITSLGGLVDVSFPNVQVIFEIRVSSLYL